MGDPAQGKNKGSHIPSSARPTNLQRNPSTVQRNPSRRVYFDQTALKSQPMIDDCENQQRGRYNSRWYTCCAWVALTIGCLTLTALILGGLFLSFIQGSVPDFRIISFEISKIETVQSGSQTLLNADVRLKLNATNTHVVGLGYGPLRVEVSSEHVNLGATTVPAFTQNPHTATTELVVQTTVNKAAVDRDDVAELKSKIEKKEVVIDLVMKGTIDMTFKGHKMKGFPLVIMCREIEEASVDTGLQPTCNVKVITFG